MSLQTSQVIKRLEVKSLNLKGISELYSVLRHKSLLVNINFEINAKQQRIRGLNARKSGRRLAQRKNDLRPELASRAH